MFVQIHPDHENYPKSILNLIDNPPTLQVLGNVNILLNKGISIIGARYCSDYGKLVTKEFCEFFSSKNINLISGLAPGIDSQVHNTALNAKTPTIGILGFGLGYLNEFENLELVNKIVDSGGCVISPFSFTQKPSKTTFIERNKVIAALSSAVVVIEATIKSGTFYTVQAAVEFDIPVFAVPGNIFSKLSKGTNELIKSGAYIADNPVEILQSVKNMEF